MPVRWGHLADQAWVLVTAAGCRLSQVKEKYGRLVTYYEDSEVQERKSIGTATSTVRLK